MNQIETELGVLTPITIFVPAYTRTEIVTILQNILTRKRDLHCFIYQNFDFFRTTRYSSIID